MIEFLAAVAAFLVAHVVPPAPPVRSRLVARFGRRAYLAAYSLLSVALIAWMVSAARRAPHLQLWEPGPWQALVPLLAMPLAIWLLTAGLSEPNPLSVTLRASGPETVPGPASAVTRHPVLWGFLLWSVSHIPPNGDLVSLVLFGGLSLLAAGGFAIADRRARSRLGAAAWRQRAAATSVIPFAAVLSGRARIRMPARSLLLIAAALSAYLWFLLDGHARLIGPDPLAWLRP